MNIREYRQFLTSLILATADIPEEVEVVLCDEYGNIDECDPSIIYTGEYSVKRKKVQLVIGQ